MGALYVQRSYGSHGVFDLVAVFRREIRLIQVKRDYIPKWELKRLKDFARQVAAPNIFVELWQYPNRRRMITRLNAPAATGS